MKTTLIILISIALLSVFLCFTSFGYDDSQKLDQEKALQLFEAANLVAGSVSPNHYFTYWETVELWQENGVNEFYKPPYSYSELCKKYDDIVFIDTSVYKTTDVENLHMTRSELYGILRSVFSKEISDYYFENVFKIKLREEDGGALKFVEKDGMIFDCGYLYGAQLYGYNRRPNVKSFNMAGKDKASLIVECTMYDYTHGKGDPVFNTFDYEFILEKESNGRWVFSKYIPLADYDYINKLPKSERYYPENWLNPNTSDSAVYITAAAGVIALCCAIVCKKKIKE